MKVARDHVHRSQGECSVPGTLIVTALLMGKPVVSIQSRFDTSCFDMNSSGEIAQKFHSLQDKFAIELEKHFG